MRSRLRLELQWVVLTTVMFAVAAFAQNDTLTVRARLVGSFLLTVQDPSTTTSAPGSVTTTLTLGSLSSMQSAPTGFTLSRATQQSTLSATIKASTVKANMTNTSYALTAHLLRALPAGVTLQINGVALTDTSTAIVTTADFGAPQDLPLQIGVDKSASNATLDNAVIFAVVPN